MTPPPKGPAGVGLGVASDDEGDGLVVMGDGAGGTSAGNRTTPEPTAIALPINTAVSAAAMRSGIVRRVLAERLEPDDLPPGVRCHSGWTATTRRVATIDESASTRRSMSLQTSGTGT